MTEIWTSNRHFRIMETRKAFWMTTIPLDKLTFIHLSILRKTGGSEPFACFNRFDFCEKKETKSMSIVFLIHILFHAPEINRRKNLFIFKVFVCKASPWNRFPWTDRSVAFHAQTCSVRCATFSVDIWKKNEMKKSRQIFRFCFWIFGESRVCSGWCTKIF